MRILKFFAAGLAALLLASCGDDDDHAGDFGQIKVPDTRQLEQTLPADGKADQGGSVTFTTEGAWTSSIVETRADGPDWIAITPDRGDAAGSYTIRIVLDSNPYVESRSAKIVITCGTSKIEIVVTQQGTDDPVTPTLNNRIAKIECFYEEEEHPEKNKPTANYYFEYDKLARVTKLSFEDLEDSAAGIDQELTFTYPDAKTLKFTSTSENGSYNQAYTVTLNAAGYATEVRRDHYSDRWTFAYDAEGRCIESEQFDIDETQVYPRSTFDWKDGDLVAIHTFDNANKPVEAYSFDYAYTELKNDAQTMSLDLNALLFDVCPGYMPIYHTDIAQVLATAGRLGRRSAHLTKTDATDEVFSIDISPNEDYLYYLEIQPENEIFEWELDDAGRVKRVFVTARVQCIQENRKTHEKTIIEEKSYTRKQIYVVSY